MPTWSLCTDQFLSGGQGVDRLSPLSGPGSRHDWCVARDQAHPRQAAHRGRRPRERPRGGRLRTPALTSREAQAGARSEHDKDPRRRALITQAQGSGVAMVTDDAGPSGGAH